MYFRQQIDFMEKLIFVWIFLTMSCNSTYQKTEKESASNLNKPSFQQTNNITELKISEHSKLQTGVPIVFTFKASDNEYPDSIVLSVNGILQPIIRTAQTSFQWDTKNVNPGPHQLIINFFWGNSDRESESIQITLLSDIIPEKYTYKVITSWPHNSKAYTQGLEFSDGYLYEGTGQNGSSMLYKIDVKKNEIIQSVNLPNDVFGEGITIFNDKVYQLTWRSNVGYVYDKNDFKKLFEFNYPTEGWGLTNNGQELIMSDGSDNIYFLDTEFFQETRRIHVYDNNGPQGNLNELEWIGNEIYANIYGTDRIVAFEPKTGKITREIDLTGLLNPKDKKEPVDVLNGIAYNASTQQLIVTGKWWPKFYHISLVKK